MDLEHCHFPDRLLYDLDSNTWVASREDGDAVIGVTSLLSAVAGKFTSARLRSTGTRVERGRSLGTLESLKFVGPIQSPISGTVSAINGEVVRRPKLLNDAPYKEGWVVRMKPLRFQTERVLLSRVVDVSDAFRKKISEYRARCFKAFPDHEMFEIGAECVAVLVRLNEFIATVPDGDVIHLVTDDPTSYVEMVRWTDQTGHSLADWRQEGNLFHFIVRKET